MDRDGSDDRDDDRDMVRDDESLSPQLLSLIVSYAADERRRPEDETSEHVPDPRSTSAARSPESS